MLVAPSRNLTKPINDCGWEQHGAEFLGSSSAPSTSKKKNGYNVGIRDISTAYGTL
jgi:hypothetical protein